MTDWENSIGKLTAILGGVGALIVAILYVWKNGKKLWKEILKPSWQIAIKPFLKFVFVALTLIIPNGFFIGYLFYRVAFFYWKLQSLDFIITNQTVFIQLVSLQTILVSLYSFLWSKFIFPKFIDWFYGHKKVDEQQNTNITFSGGIS